MLSLQQIREKITSLQNIEEESALIESIGDIFFDLIYEDSGMLVPFITDNTPHIAPTNSAPEELYLRIFTDLELADKYVAEHEGLCTETLTAVESVQLAKTAYLQGANGFILNEGDKWIVCSLPMYLKNFFSRILNDESLYDQEYVNLVSFVNQVRKNSVFHYVIDLGKRADGANTENVSVIRQIEDSESELDMSKVFPLTIQNLFNLPQGKVRVHLGQESFETTSDNIAIILNVCGYKKREDSFIRATEFANSTPPSPDCLREWRTEDVSLAFPSVQLKNEPADNSEEIDGLVEDKPIANKLTQVKDLASNSLKPCLDFLAIVRMRAATAMSKVLNKNEREEQEEESIDLDNDAATPNDNDIEGNPISQPEDKKPPQKNPLILPIVIVCVLLSCLTIFGTVHHQRQQARFEQFCAYLDDRDFGNAYMLYSESNFKNKGQTQLEETVDKLVLAYAKNNITSEELNAALIALDSFPTLNQTLELARLTAAKLESSKNAYVEGKDAKSTYEQLSIWRQVIALDEINYMAVQSAVTQDAESNIDILLAEIEHYSTRNRFFAKARYEVLAYWYNDFPKLEELAAEYETDRTTPLAIYPIRVNQITIRQETTGYWTLYINWKNWSVKTIDSICFSLVALDEKGKVISCTDTQGTWTLFDAQDIGPYAPGEGTPSENYRWLNAWYGPSVAAVQLTGVNIKYSDGSTASYTNEVDLNEIIQ